jgi:protein-S-isoprenylcysteine O-methyltransferase Ste14
MTDDILLLQVPLAAALIGYFCLHSLLASLWMKQHVARRWPSFMPAYRLAFNALSVVMLIPMLWIAHRNPGPLLWAWTGSAAWLMKGFAVAAVLGFLFSLRIYDNAVFLGWRQWRERHMAAMDPERFHLSPLHRFVRHPWYFFLLVLMWTQDIHLTQLNVYSLITLYLIVGSRLEENKLVEQHGEVYRQYRRQVPGLFPLPWRWLRKGEAEALLSTETDIARSPKKP